MTTLSNKAKHQSELDTLLDHNPARGLQWARLRYSSASRRTDARGRADAQLALIHALNVCGECSAAFALTEEAATQFQALDDSEALARVWLQAALAKTHLGETSAAAAWLEQAGPLLAQLPKTNPTVLQCHWMRARILRQQGEYADALKLFKRLHSQLCKQGAILDAARVLREIGHTHSRMNVPRALAPLEQARQIFSAHHCPAQVAHCDYFLAQAYLDLHRYGEAKQKLTAARRTFQRYSLRLFMALCDLDLGYLAAEVEQFDTALEHAKRARAAFQKAGAVGEVASCDVNIGDALLGLNRYEQALASLKDTAQKALKAGYPIRTAVCFENMGKIYERQGHYTAAFEAYHRALDIFYKAKAMERVVETQLPLGRLYFLLGDHARAHAYFNRARRVSLRHTLNAALAECELGRAHLFAAERQTERARRAARAARKISVKYRQAAQIAVCDRLLAQLETNPRRARTRLLSAQQRFAENKLVIDAALCELALGELELSWGEWRKAKRAFKKASRVLAAGFPDQRWRIHFGLGRAAEGEHKTAGAKRLYLQAAHDLAQLRGNLGVEELSNTVFGVRRAALDTALAFMVRHTFTGDTLTLTEAAKAQAFLHALAARSWRTTKRNAAHVQALAQRELVLRGELERARGKLLTSARPQAGAPLRTAAAGALANLTAREREHEQIAHRLCISQHGLSGVPALGPFDLDAFRAAARARWGDAWSALDYYLANGCLYILWVTADAVQLFSGAWTARDRWMLHQCASTQPDQRQRVYGNTMHGFTPPVTAQASLQHLAQRLVPEELLREKGPQTLLISPHGILHQLPFHALLHGDVPLLERFGFAYMPSLEAFTQLSASSSPTPSRRLLCGLEDFGARAETLKHTPRELRALNKLSPQDSTVMWQSQATRAQLLEWNRQGTLAQYNLLHFATHARIEPGAPYTSHILLADEPLIVLDVMDLQLNARLVTLSACSSAIGKGGSGDEWLGLTRAFFYAGARAIVASLWAVQDESTSRLMTQFYKNLDAGNSIAGALREAQLHLHRKGYAAYQWAPFKAVGLV